MISFDNKIIPLYNSKGDAEVFLVFPYLYNRFGEWVGWVTSDKNVYSILGYYVGYVGIFWSYSCFLGLGRADS